MNYEEFRKQTLGPKSKKSKISNSYTMKNIWRWLKKNKWLDLGQPITELQMGTIVKMLNQYYQKRLLEGNTVRFPCGMGELKLAKRGTKPFFKNGKLVIPKVIDWKSTLKNWYNDMESRVGKTLIRYNADSVYSIQYSKRKATYKNKTFFRFQPSRVLKKKLKEAINNGDIPF